MEGLLVAHNEFARAVADMKNIRTVLDACYDDHAQIAVGDLRGGEPPMVLVGIGISRPDQKTESVFLSAANIDAVLQSYPCDDYICSKRMNLVRARGLIENKEKEIEQDYRDAWNNSPVIKALRWLVTFD